MKLTLILKSSALFIYILECSGWNYFTFDTCPLPTKPIVEYYNLQGFQFIFFSERVTWNEAKLICSVYGAYLASVNTSELAKTLAEKIADSSIEMEDIWVGGHRNARDIWEWIDESVIPLVAENGYPPWIRQPHRKTKSCLAMDRRKHYFPLFVDLHCSLPKPFICQRNILDNDNSDLLPPTQRITVGNSTFILYSNTMSWSDAAGFCRTRGYRLAVIENLIQGKSVVKAMLRSRPSFENIWIACYYYDKHWRWLSKANTLPSFPDPDTNYPPWLKHYVNSTAGCVLFDRHYALSGNFVATRCNRKKGVLCEDYFNDNKESVELESIPIKTDDLNLLLVLKSLSWSNASNYCLTIGGHLAEVESTKALTTITTIMARQISEPRHAWLGGKLINLQWLWATSKKNVIKQNMPWCVDEEDDPLHACLNLDRNFHDQPNIYGLNCNRTQPFVCNVGKP